MSAKAFNLRRGVSWNWFVIDYRGHKGNLATVFFLKFKAHHNTFNVARDVDLFRSCQSGDNQLKWLLAKLFFLFLIFRQHSKELPQPSSDWFLLLCIFLCRFLVKMIISLWIFERFFFEWLFADHSRHRFWSSWWWDADYGWYVNWQGFDFVGIISHVMAGLSLASGPKPSFEHDCSRKFRLFNLK